MEVTIDKLGRLVIPKPLRDRFNLRAGTRLQLEVESRGMRIRLPDDEPPLQRRQGILVHHGGETVDLDIAGFIRGERETRVQDIVQAIPGEP